MANTLDTIIACSRTWDVNAPPTTWQWVEHYIAGEYPPHYPVPAIPLKVVLLNRLAWIDNVQNEDDPIMVYACQNKGTWTMKDGILDKFTYNV